MKYKTLLLLLLTLILMIFAQTIGAQTLLNPGDPDPEFGTNGRALTPIANCYVGAAIVLPDGKILTLCTGSAHSGESILRYFHLVRHNPNGSLDTEFGVEGVQSLPVGGGHDTNGKLLYRQPDGKIIIGGNFDNDFGLMRVNADGSLDTTFGTGGQVRTDFSGFEENSRDGFYGLAARPDGRLLVYGRSTVEDLVFSCPPTSICYPPEFQRLAIAQYNADGSPDTSFGENGVVRSRFTNDDHLPQFLTIEPDGKFLFIVGLYERTSYYDRHFAQVAVRYNADGSVDVDYGKNGMKDLPNRELVSLPDGKLLGFETCNSYQPCGYNVRFSRLNSDLTPDSTFGSNGLAPYDLFFLYYGKLHPQPDGKFIFANYRVYGPIGSSQAATYFYRFNSDGSVDSSFGSNGVIGFDLDGDNILGSYAQPTLILQPDGKILAVGEFYPPQNTQGMRGIAMMRFIGRTGKRNY